MGEFQPRVWWVVGCHAVGRFAAGRNPRPTEFREGGRIPRNWMPRDAGSEAGEQDFGRREINTGEFLEWGGGGNGKAGEEESRREAGWRVGGILHGVGRNGRSSFRGILKGGHCLATGFRVRASGEAGVVTSGEWGVGRVGNGISEG